MTFERTFDLQAVKAIVTHRRIYPYVTDDFRVEPEQWEPHSADCVWYVLVKDSDELLGMFTFVPENSICWKVHTCLLPIAYGQRARAAGKEMAQWIWGNTACQRIITDVPADNRLAFRFAESAGMKVFGKNPASIQRNGHLVDVLLLGMSKSGN